MAVGKHEAGQQDLRQEQEEGHLHGLELGAGKSRDEDAQAQRGNDVDRRGEIDIQQRAAHRHLEHEPAEQEDQADLNQADEHIGHHLADGQFQR